MTEEEDRKEDRKEERNTIKNALNICGYPDWTIKRVEENLRNKEETKGNFLRETAGKRAAKRTKGWLFYHMYVVCPKN